MFTVLEQQVHKILCHQIICLHARTARTHGAVRPRVAAQSEILKVKLIRPPTGLAVFGT